MKFSDLPLRYRVLAITLFLGVMTVWALVWGKIVDATPDWLVGYFVVAMLCTSIAYLAGYASAQKDYENGRLLPRDPDDPFATASGLWKLTKRFLIYVAVVVSILTAVALLGYY